MIATLSSSATGYTDYDWTFSSSYSAYQVEYDVRTHYRVNDTYSGASWMGQLFSGGQSQANKDQSELTTSSSPEQFSISTYPNPFNPSTQIRYNLPEAAHVVLQVYDMMGRKISTLTNESKVAGSYIAVWNGKDEAGNAVASGTYLYRIFVTMGTKQAIVRSGKLLLTK